MTTSSPEMFACYWKWNRKIPSWYSLVSKSVLTVWALSNESKTPDQQELLNRTRKPCRFSDAHVKWSRTVNLDKRIDELAGETPRALTCTGPRLLTRRFIGRVYQYVPQAEVALVCHKRCYQVRSPNSTFTIRDLFTCTSENFVYCISGRKCSHIYNGETDRSLRRRCGKDLRSMRNNTFECPVAQHFNSAGHMQYHQDVHLRGMRLCRGTNILRRQLTLALTRLSGLED